MPYIKKKTIQNVYLNHKHTSKFTLNNYYTFDNFDIYKKID